MVLMAKTGLIERLRIRAGDMYDSVALPFTADLLREAADEIERLTKTTEEIGKPRSSGPPYNDEGVPL